MSDSPDGIQMDGIHCMDCLEGMRQMKDNSVDAIITDPPYGITMNVWDVDIDLDSLFSEQWRILREDGVIAMTAQQPFTSTLVCHQRKRFRYELIWDKGLVSGFLNANRQPLRCHESILIFSRKPGIYNPQKWQGKKKNHSKKIHKPTTNYGEHHVVDNSEEFGCWKHPRSIITFQKPHPSVAVHPTEKPVELLLWLIKTFTNEGQIVLDPFLGSGTTALAAKMLGRRYVGFELNPKYFEIAKARVDAYPDKREGDHEGVIKKKQLSLFEVI